MARKLYVKQKKFLDKLLTENPEINHADDMSGEDWEKLTAMYEWESIYHHAERYINDFRTNERFG